MTQQSHQGLDYRRGKVKNAKTITYRPMTIDEATRLSASHVAVADQHGNVRTAKVNGRVRTWKRDAGRVEVPLKYGLYDFFTDVAVGGVMHAMVVVIEDQEDQS